MAYFVLSLFSFLLQHTEVLKFADRNFYRDWWNATTIDVFWRSWNMPIHQWAFKYDFLSTHKYRFINFNFQKIYLKSRHLYMPLIEKGYSKTFSSVSVFLLSALFHEYLFGVSVRVFNGWIFSGMILQLCIFSSLLFIFTFYLKKKKNK